VPFPSYGHQGGSSDQRGGQPGGPGSSDRGRPGFNRPPNH
jgi:hypothetical protein